MRTHRVRAKLAGVIQLPHPEKRLIFIQYSLRELAYHRDVQGGSTPFRGLALLTEWRWNLRTGISFDGKYLLRFNQEFFSSFDLDQMIIM
jgi:hypothetical protein